MTCLAYLVSSQDQWPEVMVGEPHVDGAYRHGVGCEADGGCRAGY